MSRLAQAIGLGLAVFLLGSTAVLGGESAVLKIGDAHAGGIIYSLEADGHSGMVISAEDVASPSTWTGAIAACKAAELGGTFGWTLPGSEQWDLVYANLVQAGQGGFEAAEWYWSASPGYGEGWARAMDLKARMTYGDRHPILSVDSYFRVRAVKAFHRPWSYDGNHGPAPELGADAWPAAEGQRQSPIDIPADAAPTTLAVPDVQWDARPVHVTNNGHTLQMDAGGMLVVGGQKYHLLQYHFHTPSEHTLRGKQFPMAAHFVHAKDVNGKADTSQLLVIGVFFEAGQTDNPALEPMWQDLPQVEGETADGPPSTTQNPATLLGDVLQGKVYRYEGSLTTPPCSETVTWYVCESPLSASTTQIEAFSKLFHGDNARPVQPLHGRQVQVSK